MTTQQPGRTLVARAASSTLLRHALVALGIVVIALFVLTALDDYRNRQLTELAYIAMAACGLTVLTGINGQISLGHGAFMAIGAYTTALLMQDADSGPGLPIVLLASLLVALVVGMVVGVAAARLRGPYLAGATLTLAIAVPGIARQFSGTLGGEQGLRVVNADPPDALLDAIFFATGVDASDSQFAAITAWVLLAVVLFLLANLVKGRVGRRWAAVRDDEVAAELAGIDLGRARVAAFAVSSAVAGLAGSLMAMQIRLAAPTAFELTLSLTLLAAVVLGGLGTLSGAVIGALLLTFTTQVATDFGTARGLDAITAAELAPLAYGLVLIVVIILAPAGLVGTVLRAVRSRRAGQPRDDTTRSASPEPTPDRSPEHTGTTSPTRKGTP